MIGVQCQLVISRGHIRALEHIRAHFKYFHGWQFFGKSTFKSYFALWSSFPVKLERVINELGGQKICSVVNQTWSSGIQCKNRKFCYLGSRRSEKRVLFWAQNIKVPFGMGHPHLHIKSSLYVWRRAHGSQIFKQNSIISICSCFIEFLRFWLLRLQVGRAGGLGYLGWSVWF